MGERDDEILKRLDLVLAEVQAVEVRLTASLADLRGEMSARLVALEERLGAKIEVVAGMLLPAAQVAEVRSAGSSGSMVSAAPLAAKPR